MLKVSAVPKWPLGREKRVDFIQRTWCSMDCQKLELMTMWSMAWWLRITVWPSL